MITPGKEVFIPDKELITPGKEVFIASKEVFIPCKDVLTPCNNVLRRNNCIILGGFIPETVQNEGNGGGKEVKTERKKFILFGTHYYKRNSPFVKVKEVDK